MTDVAPEPPAAGNPAVFGLLAFSVGGTALGISLVGYVSAAAQGTSVMPIVLAGTGLGLLLTTLWAIHLEQTFVATVFGAFTGFWLSYALLVLSLSHNWFPIPAADVPHSVAQFLIAWDVVIAALAIVSVRVPLAFTAILTSAFVAVSLLIAGTLNGSTVLPKVAGVFTLLYSAVGFYSFLATAIESVGGRAMPLGTPLAQLMHRLPRLQATGLQAGTVK